MSLKNLARLFCPPILIKCVRFFLGNQIRFKGNYATWEEAKTHSTGYDRDLIFQKVKEATIKVVSGDAIYERDSVCFYEKHYRWPLLSCLMFIASKQNNQLKVIDFGGALGSLYFQHKFFLSSLNELKWTVIEQEHFVKYGISNLQNDELRFYSTLEGGIEDAKSNTILLSSVLQYIENPQELLKQIARLDFKYILIDRTPFISSDKDRLTVQIVPDAIYTANLSIWFFSKQGFYDLMRELGYECVCDFDSSEKFGLGVLNGMFFERTNF